MHISNITFPKILNLLSNIMIHCHFPTILCIYVNNFHHYYVSKKINKYFVASYNNLKKNKYYGKNNLKNNKIIWTFWWQGIDNMPIIVNQCIKSIRKYSPHNNIKIITKYNFSSYINIPNYILSKLNNGDINLPHFSDIVRFKLLEKYGGLWIDSTIYCNNYLNDYYFNDIYTSGGNKNKYNKYVSGKWSSFLIGGSEHNDIFIFMNYFYDLYLKENRRIIDYFLIDYALEYVYKKNIGNFKKYVNNIAYKNNPHIHNLEKLLNYQYNEAIYRNISCDTNMFKLTYKKKLSQNKDTFYNRIINHL